MHKAFTPKVSGICTIHPCRSLLCWQLRDIAFSSTFSVPY